MSKQAPINTVHGQSREGGGGVLVRRCSAVGNGKYAGVPGQCELPAAYMVSIAIAVSTVRLFSTSWADTDTRCRAPCRAHCLSLWERICVLRPGTVVLGTRATRPQDGSEVHLRLVWDVVGDGHVLT